MEVRLQVRLTDQRVIEGPELDSPLSADDAEILKSLYYLPGAVAFEHADQSITIRDDLEQLIGRLCVWSVPRLQAGEEVKVGLFTDPSEVELRPQGSQLTIAGSWGASAVFPLDECLQGLIECARTFVAFLEANFGGKEPWREKITDFKFRIQDLEGNSDEISYAEAEESFAMTEEEIARVIAENNEQADSSGG